MKTYRIRYSIPNRLTMFPLYKCFEAKSEKDAEIKFKEDHPELIFHCVEEYIEKGRI